MFASRSQLSLYLLLLPIQDSRWQTSPYITLLESLFVPLSSSWAIIWDLFSLCSRCYSQNAKSEIEEVTHVICLATVCLDATMSAMKIACTLCFLSHKTKMSNKSICDPCLRADSCHCTAPVHFNGYVYICKCININIIMVSVYLVIGNDRLMVVAWLRLVNQCCWTVSLQLILHFAELF